MDTCPWYHLKGATEQKEGGGRSASHITKPQPSPHILAPLQVGSWCCAALASLLESGFQRRSWNSVAVRQPGHSALLSPLSVTLQSCSCAVPCCSSLYPGGQPPREKPEWRSSKTVKLPIANLGANPNVMYHYATAPGLDTPLGL